MMIEFENGSYIKSIDSLQSVRSEGWELGLFEYSIPENIKSRIPDYFYYALGGEFVSIFGKDALIRDEDGVCLLDYSTNSTGYAVVLRMTCKKLDMDWLFDYWQQLPWHQSDAFDGELANEVMMRFDKEETANPYYHYLLNKGKAQHDNS